MERLVIKAKNGSHTAFIKLLESRLNSLYRIAYSYLKDGDSASDAVQDSVLIAYKSIKSLKDNSKFDSWITSILVNRCRDILRKNKKIKFEEYCDETISSPSRLSDQYSKVETNIDVLNALQELDEKHRDVITLKYLGDYSIAEISSALNIPEGTVKSRLNTGLKKLKSIMEVSDDGMQSCIR